MLMGRFFGAFSEMTSGKIRNCKRAMNDGERGVHNAFWSFRVDSPRGDVSVQGTLSLALFEVIHLHLSMYPQWKHYAMF